MKRIVLVARAWAHVAVSACLAASCGPTSESPDAGVETPQAPDLVCPGGPTCSAAVSGEPLLAAAGKRVVTPTAYEIANPLFLRRVDVDDCAPEGPRYGGVRRCGTLKDTLLDDCGRDGLCFGDEGWTAPDDDGSENDGDLTEWFADCGRDRICPDNVVEDGAEASDGVDNDGDGLIDGDDVAYATPDADGSEGDGVFEGLWLAGYDNNRPAMGVKDDVEARAIVLRQGDTTLALCTVDAVGLFHDEQNRIRDRVEATRPGEVDLLLLQASHSHEAPDTMGQWGFSDPFTGVPDEPGRDELHMEKIRQGCTEAIVESLDHLVAVTVHVGRTEPGVEGLVRDGRDPQIFNDDIITIGLDDASSGTAVATLLSWGNHPESLDSDNSMISSDYVHRLRTALEDGLPQTATYPAHAPRGGVAVYLQGAVGGIMGPNRFVITGRDGTAYEDPIKSFARTDALGELIAEYGLQALEAGETLAAPTLAFSNLEYKVPVENLVFHFGLFKGWFDRAVVDYDATQPIAPGNLPTLVTGAAVVRLGDIAFVTAPGELFPESFVGFDVANSFGRTTIAADNPNPPDLAQAPTSPTLRDLLDAKYAMPLGLCQDETGYLVPPYDFKLSESSPYVEEADGDHYEETNSVGPQAVPRYLSAVDVLIGFERARAER